MHKTIFYLLFVCFCLVGSVGCTKKINGIVVETIKPAPKLPYDPEIALAGLKQYPFWPKSEFVSTNIILHKVKFHDMQRICEKVFGACDEEKIMYGIAIIPKFSQDKKCHVYVPTEMFKFFDRHPVLSQAVIGHEILHCFFGEWHSDSLDERIKHEIVNQKLTRTKEIEMEQKMKKTFLRQLE